MVYICFKTKVARHRVKEFHENFPKMMRILERHGGKSIGVWNVEMGPISVVVYLWAAASLEAYEKALTELHQDPEMKPVGEVLFTIYTDSERWLLRPTPYSPLQ